MEHFPLVNHLHTDVLEDKYGPISSKVLKHDSKIRIAHLIDSKGISRTFAITFLTPQRWTPKIKTINHRIQAGEPIGKAFRQYGYSIRKNVLDVYIIDIPSWLQKDFRITSPGAKARISEFLAKREGSSPILYGEVVEIYSPDFRMPVINDIDKSQISAFAESLEKQGFSLNQIWDRITRGNDWRDAAKNFSVAKVDSIVRVGAFKKKIFEILWSLGK